MAVFEPMTSSPRVPGNETSWTPLPARVGRHVSAHHRGQDDRRRLQAGDVREPSVGDGVGDGRTVRAGRRGSGVRKSRATFSQISPGVVPLVWIWRTPGMGGIGPAIKAS
jgi:hypothetical protein